MSGLAMAGVVAMALLAGLAIGWFLGGRGAAAERAQAAKREDDFKRAITDLASAEERARAADGLREELRQANAAREGLAVELATLRADAKAFEARLAEMRAAKEQMGQQFAELSAKALNEAQQQFLQRAEERFRQSEESAGQNLKALLTPVNERLARYEEAVSKVEAERRDAFGELKGQIEQMRLGQERVSQEAAKLVNSLRSAPKLRGSWGEETLKNVLESSGLSQHIDFLTEVSVGDEESGRLRPDVIINVPGGRNLVIDSKVSINSYQDAIESHDDLERKRHFESHARSMRNHVNTLSAKSYWSQFDEAPDYVIMFVPGEQFLSAALEVDEKLWSDAFQKKVLLATPTNLIAIAKTVASIWRQEKLSLDASRIGALGRELYERLAISAQHLRVVGTGLSTAVNNYNKFVGSFERNVLSSARRLKEMNIDPPSRALDDVSELDALPRYGSGEALDSEGELGASNID